MPELDEKTKEHLSDELVEILENMSEENFIELMHMTSAQTAARMIEDVDKDLREAFLDKID